MSNVTEIFGCDVFNDEVMKARLPEETYKALKKTIKEKILVFSLKVSFTFIFLKLVNQIWLIATVD